MTLEIQRQEVVTLHLHTTEQPFTSRAESGEYLLNSSYPDNKNPFDEGQAKSRDGPVSASSWCRQTERQEEADPVEEECHWWKKKKNVLMKKEHFV